MHQSRPLGPLAPLVILLVLAACNGSAAASAPAESQPQSQESAAAASQPASEASSAAGANGEVRLAGGAFVPNELTVSVGTEVVFTNEDSFAHTVTEGTDGEAAADPIVDEEVAAGGEVRFTFDEAGTFDITCRFHPDMQMTVTVEG